MKQCGDGVTDGTFPYRWVLVAVFVIDMLISGYYRRKTKKSGSAISRKAEGFVLMAGRLAIAGPLYGSLLAYMINPGWMEWSAFDVTDWVKFGGSLVLIATVPLTYWVMRSIGSGISETVLTKKDQRLVTSGPYRRVRHPLYTDGLLLFTGAVCVSGNWFIGSFTVIAAVVLLLVVIPKEEDQLIKKFGDEYRTYRQGTGRLIPKISGSGRKAG